MGATAVIAGEDYIDEDVAYLLGMLFGRGQLIDQGDVRRLVITLHIRRDIPKLPPGVKAPSLNLDLENERALNAARRRINDLLDANVDIHTKKQGKTSRATLTAVFVKPTIAWRDLRYLCSNGSDNSNFLLPESFFALPETLYKEFLRGFGDVAVTPSYADNAWGQQARIAFPVVHNNTEFAQQLLTIFEQLDIAAQLLEGSASKRGGTRREHRIRLYAEEYEKVGFHFSHKNELLKILAEFNRHHSSPHRKSASRKKKK